MNLLRILLLQFITWLVECSVTADVELEAIQLYAKLDADMYQLSPIYDGDQCVYLFGGYRNDVLDTILRYNISSDTIEEFATFPVPRKDGFAVSDKNGNMYYIGGTSYEALDGDIYKLNITSRSVELVGQLDYPIMGVSPVKLENGEVLLLGTVWKDNNYIPCAYCLQLDTLASCGLKTFISDFRFPINFATSDHAYILEQFDFEKLDLLTLTSEIIEPLLSIRLSSSSAVFDGNMGYIIGGWSDSNSTPINNIIQFNPTTYEQKLIPVKNYLGDQTTNFWSPASVYIDEMRRIYIFGGYAYPRSNDSFGIKYIDLSPLDDWGTPTTSTTMSPEFKFSCEDRREGLYPHPSNCAKFIACYDDEDLPIYYDCPIGLLYNPQQRACVDSDSYECLLTCQEKIDGHYPHPHDCAWFIICQKGQFSVEECPPDHYFHPGVLTCLRQQLVDCDADTR